MKAIIKTLFHLVPRLEMMPLWKGAPEPTASLNCNINLILVLSPCFHLALFMADLIPLLGGTNGFFVFVTSGHFVEEQLLHKQSADH